MTGSTDPQPASQEPHPDRFTHNLVLALFSGAFLWMAPYQTGYVLMGFGLGYWWRHTR